MKKMLYFGAAIALGMAVGCSGNSPEGAAKDYIEDHLQISDSISMKTNALTYTITEKSDTAATISVKGVVRCKGKLNLTAKDGKWQVTE